VKEEKFARCKNAVENIYAVSTDKQKRARKFSMEKCINPQHCEKCEMEMKFEIE
jgi:hypothetical protein